MKKEKKENFYYRKNIFYFLAVLVGITLLSVQFFLTRKKIESSEFTFFPVFEMEKVIEGVKMRSDNLGEVYQSGKEEIGRSLEVDETIEKLVEEEVISEEEKKEFLEKNKEEDNPLKLIDREIIKEENGTEEK